MTGRRYLPGQLVVRTRPGWELEHVATNRDVRMGRAAAALSLDRGGAIDAVLRQASPAMQVARAFGSRRGVELGAGHLQFDELEHELGLARTFRVSLDPAAAVADVAAALGSLADVEMATPAYVCATPFGPAGSVTAERRDADPGDRARAVVGADRALALEPGDSALIVGLVDSGVDDDHPELAGRLRPGVSSVALRAAVLDGDLRVISGARPHLQDVADDEGHGTGCAGLLGALGYRIGRGVAGAARLLPIRALCGALPPGATRPTAIGLLPDIDSGLKTAVDLGARVINLSFGTAEAEVGDGPVPHVEVVRYALARGCLLIAASGNTGKAGRYFPAALPGVIAVGAVDDDRRPAGFTTRGDHVALSAPGVRIRTCDLDGYTRHSGTSFAAPFVTGACALMMARAARASRALSPERARRLLIDSAQAFAPGADATGCGGGVLDIPAALAAVDASCRADDEVDATAA